MKLTDMDKIQLIADEQSRNVFRKLIPFNTEFRFSAKDTEHTYFLVEKCNVMAVRRELGMIDWK